MAISGTFHLRYASMHFCGPLEGRVFSVMAHFDFELQMAKIFNHKVLNNSQILLSVIVFIYLVSSLTYNRQINIFPSANIPSNTIRFIVPVVVYYQNSHTQNSTCTPRYGKLTPREHRIINELLTQPIS